MPNLPPATFQAADEVEALELLHQHQCTDGLPVVIPTPERVDRMVLASGLDADIDLGTMGPGGGATTIVQVATNAVMAGCLPDYMPVVVAAMQAMLQPDFDLAEVQSTTHSIAPLMIVNGPMITACDLTGGFGALGPGHRANASIGRAVRLCMMNIGGARPGTSDMALLGHPGKFSFCMAEDEASSPWEPLSESLGYAPGTSAVTIVGTEAPHNVVFVNNADDPNSPQRLLRALAAVMANTGSNNASFSGGTVAVALNPEHAEVLHQAGMTRRDVQNALHQLATNKRGHLLDIAAGFIKNGDHDDDIPAVKDADNVIVYVGGASGLYSAVFPSWAAGAHNNPVVHHPIETDQACVIPGMENLVVAGDAL